MIGKRIIAAMFAAGLIVVVSSCSDTRDYVRDHKAAQGALIGTGVGAVGGAVVGEATTGQAAKGAVIGGLVGAAAGAGTGYYLDKKDD